MVNIGLSLRQLQLFVLAGLTQNLTRVAEQVHLTVPAVSKQLRLLEQHYDVNLFERVGNRLALTEHGQRLLPQAKQLLSDLKAFDYQMRSLVTREKTEIKINIADTFQGLVFNALHAFDAEAHQAEVAITVNRWIEQQAVMRHHASADAADEALYISSESPGAAEEYRCYELCLMRFVVVAHPDHALAAKSHVTARDLASATWLTSDTTSRSALAASEYVAQLHPEKPVTHLVSYDSMAQAVMADLGIALLPDVLVAGAIARQRLVQLAVANLPAIKSSLTLLHARNLLLTQQHIEFIEHMQQTFANR